MTQPPLVGAADAQPPLEELGGGDYRTVVEKRLEKFAASPTKSDGTAMPFSGVIAFQLEDGRIIKHAHSLDQATLNEDQPFNVLSVGKLFTATAIMQLCEEKKFRLGLDTPLSELLTSEEMELQLKDAYEEEKLSSEHLEALRKNSSSITLRHLLTHTSGLSSMDPCEEYDPKKLGKFQYSNYGYRLLAIVIGKWSENGNPKDPLKGFERHIRERIFEPAGMQGAISEMDLPAKGPDRFVMGEKFRRTKVEEKDTTYVHGNGCFRMKADDLLAFGRALQKNMFFRDEQIFQDMITPVFTSQDMQRDDTLPNRGLGFLLQLPGHPEGYGHAGGGKGMTSFLWTWTATTPPLTVVMLSNYENRYDEHPHRILEEKLSEIFQQ